MRSVLVVAAHPDDEVLGCGGTIARCAFEGRKVHVLILADGETSRQGSADIGTRVRAAKEAGSLLGAVDVELVGLPDNRMDEGALLSVVRRIEGTIARVRPYTVLTHHANDVNVDHGVVHRAVLAATRPQPGNSVRELLYFEVPSSTEWQTPSTFTPNYFVDITETIQIKIDALRSYAGEMRRFPHARSYQAVEALARWRGATVGVGAAEAFMLGRRVA